MRKLLVIFCLVGVFSIGASSAVEASDYPKYDGEISPIDFPIEILYRPSFAGRLTFEMFYLADLGSKKIEFFSKIPSLVEVKKKNDHLILSAKIDTGKASFTINGQDASDKLKARRGLTSYFEITDTGELLKSNNKVDANSTFYIAPKLTTSVIEKPDQLISEFTHKFVSSKKILISVVWKAFAVGTSKYKDRKVLVAKVIGKMDSGGMIQLPLQGYQLIDITAGYALETKLGGAKTLRPSELGFKEDQVPQVINLSMKLRTIFDLPVSSFRSLQNTATKNITNTRSTSLSSDYNQSDLTECLGSPVVYLDPVVRAWDRCIGTEAFAKPHEHAGVSYTGEWKGGGAHGKGTITFSAPHQHAGRKYTGDLKDRKKHGRGTLTISAPHPMAGYKYVGEYKAGKANGEGTITIALPNKNAGYRWFGEFKDDRQNGQGTEIYSPPHTFAGFKFVGEWKNGAKHGRGILTYPVGKSPPKHKGVKSVEGIWENNKLIKTIKLIPIQASKPEPTAGTQTETLSLKKAKEECAGLGFKKGTEKYGECVLQLHK